MLGSALVAHIGLALSRNRPLVVLYHGVTATSVDKTSIRNYRQKHIPTDVFEKQIGWLSNNFKIVPLKEIEELCNKKIEPTEPLCAITFDDGYRDNFLEAYPILKKRGLPATIFVTTGFIDGTTALWTDLLEESISVYQKPSLTIPWDEHDKIYPTTTCDEKIAADLTIRFKLKKIGPGERAKILSYLAQETGVTMSDILSRKDYAPLSWEEIKEMSQNGITIGAHTEHHPILSRLSETEQREEIALSVDKIRSTIGHCDHFAYPNGQRGDWNEVTKKILTELQIQYAWTTAGRRVQQTENPLELPRITIDTDNFNRFRSLTGNVLPFLKSLYKK